MSLLTSIIVSIYNVENYLERCLSSILNQTEKNYEVLLIDDGSIDNSATIAKKYACRDSRFKYIYKENGGLSSVRNLGVDNATGDFLAFIDGDDFVSYDFIEKALSAFTDEVDIVIGNYAIYDYKNDKYYHSKKKFIETKHTLNKCHIIQDVIYNSSYYISVCFNMYRTKILKENNTYFVSERLVYSEDQLFNLIAYNKARTIVEIPNIIYYHLIISNSLSQRYRENMLQMNYERYIRIIGYLRNNDYNEIALIYEDYWSYLFVDSMVMMCRCKFLLAMENISKIIKNPLSNEAHKKTIRKLDKFSYKLIFIASKTKSPFLITLLIKSMLMIKTVLRRVEKKRVRISD